MNNHWDYGSGEETEACVSPQVNEYVPYVSLNCLLTCRFGGAEFFLDTRSEDEEEDEMGDER